MKKFVWLIAVLVTASCGGAFQGATFSLPQHLPKHAITCVVQDASGAPIVGARCETEGLRGVTNQDGDVVLLGVPEGSRIVVATRDGYNTGATDYQNDRDQTVTVTLTRKP